MSARNTVSPGTSAGGGGGNPIYDPDEQPPARLYVDGRRVPIVNDGVTLRVRKDGPLGLNRAADVSFPIEGINTDWLSVVRYEQDTTLQSELVRASVDMYDESLETYVTAIDGFVMGVGPGGRTNNDMKLRIGGPSLLTNKVTATASYTTSATVGEILRDAVEQIDAQQPIFDNLSVTTTAQTPFEQDGDGTVRAPETELTSVVSARGPLELADPSTELRGRGPKRFVPRKHSVADLLAWVEDTFGVRCWFEVSSNRQGGDTPRLVAAKTPASVPRYGRNLDGGVGVFEANPLAEVSPINGLRVQGATKHLADAGNLGTFQTPLTASEFPVAVAFAPSLVERAGSLLLGFEDAPKVGNEAELKPLAKSRLKERLSTAGSGSIVTQLTPTLRPFQMFSTLPVTEGSAASVDPQTYEIEEVAHHAEADGAEVTYWSDLSVSVATPLDDIQVTTRTVPIETPGRATFSDRTDVLLEELGEVDEDVDLFVEGIYTAIFG